MYERFAEQLRDETGIDCDYAQNEGVLTLSTTDETAAGLQERYEWLRNAGCTAELLSGDDVRRLEPLVTAPVKKALFMPRERSVTPRRLVNALRESCLRRGVSIETGMRVESISANKVTCGGTRFDASRIVIASGAWSPEIKGLNPPIPVEPRKGQILSLASSPNAFRRMIRWQHTYFVPRSSGELIVGATEENAGFDRANTPAGIGRLLNEAQQISSHVGSYPISDMWSGLRPATPDRMPILGWSSIKGVLYATGHYRNGILLTPVTASIVADLVNDRKPDFCIDPFLPSRFLQQAV
jgi:glycine oxidase